MMARILIVEDEPLSRQVLQRRLSKAGYDVDSADNGRMALQTLTAADTLPDVILTDLHMPEVNGYDLCASVRRNPRLAHLPIIIMSALDGAEYREIVQPFNVARYLTKPLAMDEVFAAIADALVS
jgi:two-component system cell cycle response regulator